LTTANTIIRDAMVGIGAIGTTETPGADEGALALRHLNRMLDTWKLHGLFAYAVSEQVFSLTSAMQTRTIGSGGQVNTTRPIRVETGSFVRVSSVDTPLRIASRDQWGSIDLKTLAGAPPEWVYYEATSPLGILHFWPQADCEVHLMLQTQLTAFADLATNYTLPPGYEEALELSLAERLCASFSRPVPADLKISAANARRAIKVANNQVPELEIPSGQRVHGSMAAFNAG
jgi:hypothetical protein